MFLFSYVPYIFRGGKLTRCFDQVKGASCVTSNKILRQDQQRREGRVHVLRAMAHMTYLLTFSPPHPLFPTLHLLTSSSLHFTICFTAHRPFLTSSPHTSSHLHPLASSLLRSFTHHRLYQLETIE